MHSQNDEERYIRDYFGEEKGTFLDIGAYDGSTFSNTRWLALNGWKGVCIEPEDKSFAKLRDLYENDPNIELFKNCVGDKTEDNVIFYDSDGNACSTTNKEDAASWGRYFPFVETSCNMLTITDLIEKSKYKTFDYVTIDLEDNSLGVRVLRELDVEKRKVRMVCAEGLDVHKNEIRDYLKEKGFEIAGGTPENIILIIPKNDKSS